MNMKFAAVAALAVMSLIVLAPQAAAADNGFYLGAGITDTEFHTDELGRGSLDDNSFKVIAGFRPLDWLAFEANYIDLGSESDGGASVDAHALTASGLLLAEIGIVDLYARAGFANWKATAKSALSTSASDDGWEPTYGVGVGLHFGSVGVRAEYERFSAEMFDALNTDVNTFSVSVTYTFL
jgi:OmpA-OmpF porin, OOP family